MQRYASSAASALLGAYLAAVAFGASGGFQLDRTTWTEIGLVLSAGVVLAAALLRPARRGGAFPGALTLAAFVLLAAVVGLSILWSSAPDDSWLEANLTISYVATFAGAVAIARMAPDGWAVLLRAILIAATAVVLYALATRIWPSGDENDLFARLGEPYRYWNALGATAALAVPPALWLGARRSGHPPANALAYPLMSLFVVTIFLSYSRAAIVVAGIGALVWLAFVPLRLRSVTVLGISLAGAAPVVIWALQKDAFTKNAQSLAVKQSVATEFGLFLLATVIVTLGTGLAIGFRVARRPPRARARLRLGVALGTVAVAAPLVMFVVLSGSDRGLGGTIKAGYESLTSTSHKTSSGPGRLLSASSSRGLYWHQAREVFESHYWRGTGANTFGVARLRFRDPADQSVSQHAHSYLHQTAADLGIAGLAATLLLLFAWLFAAGRAVGALRRRRTAALPWGADRVALVALALTAVVYGLHSAVDWIWYVPGPTVMALIAAGFVAGRGSLRARDDADAVDAAGPATTMPVVVPAAPVAVAVGAGAGPGVATAAPPPPPPPPPPPGYGANGHGDGAVTQVLPALPPPPPPPPPPPRAPRRMPPALRPILALLSIAAALICAWAIWQPLRSDRQSDHALDLAAADRFPQAVAAADRAGDFDPLTPRPYVVKSSIQDAAGRPQDALSALEGAVRAFPGDPQVWLQLGQYQLNSLNHPADALAVSRAALYLDPQSRAAQTLFLQSTAALHPLPLPPPVVPPVTPATPGPPPASAPSTGGAAP